MRSWIVMPISGADWKHDFADCSRRVRTWKCHRISKWIETDLLLLLGELFGTCKLVGAAVQVLSRGLQSTSECLGFSLENISKIKISKLLGILWIFLHSDFKQMYRKYVHFILIVLLLLPFCWMWQYREPGKVWWKICLKKIVFRFLDCKKIDSPLAAQTTRDTTSYQSGPHQFEPRLKYSTFVER